MKAIHNVKAMTLWSTSVGNYKLKYNFESNSQPKHFVYKSSAVGNYKLKYNFESNSQPITSSNGLGFCWEL